jgi:hypothetical protein
MGRFLALALVLAALPGCGEKASAAESQLAAAVRPAAERDYDLDTCRARVADALAEPAAPGAPGFEKDRVSILGRAMGEPTVFVAAPALPATGAPAADVSGGEEMRIALVRGRIASLRGRYKAQPAELRARVLRQGYVYSDDAHEAFALVQELTLGDLFAEEEIWLARGERVDRLVKRRSRFDKSWEYAYTEGPDAGRSARLYFADRVAPKKEDLGEPLHRDVRALRDRVGFDRMKIEHLANKSIVASLRIAGEWTHALVTADGAHLELGCLDAPREARERMLAAAHADEPRRRALAALRDAVSILVEERLPFDRPRNAEDHLSDGQLRPSWRWAYQRGDHGFGHDEQGYPVFDADGRPYPPETCVEFILDAYERGSGTWFRPASEPRGRTAGGLDFDALGLLNRSGVIGFSLWAGDHQEIFDIERFPIAERIPFRDRERYFQNLLDRADTITPGDIVAIQGIKRDGNIHQHAILVEDVDPLTGFAYGLADQMKRPRRRTWEGIMNEAPLRALFWHLKPKADLLLRLDPERRAALAASGG